MIKQDSLGWKVPEKCDRVHAFKLTDKGFDIEYKREGFHVDLHLRRYRLPEFNGSEPVVLNTIVTCGACGKRSIHGVKYSDGGVEGVHKSCYLYYQYALQELKQKYPSSVLLEFL